MLSRRLLIAITLCFSALCSGVALPVAASEGGEGKAAAAPSVQLGAIGIPIMENGKLVNYIFLNIKINLGPKANETKLREMEPYFRDALIRVSSKVSFGQVGKNYLLDEPRFKQVMTAEWSKITGAGNIKSVDIVSQSPKRMPRNAMPPPTQ